MLLIASKFANMPYNQKYKFAIDGQLVLSCLGCINIAKYCQSQRCHTSKGPHHTLLFTQPQVSSRPILLRPVYLIRDIYRIQFSAPPFQVFS